jgi:hypothetical protein
MVKLSCLISGIVGKSAPSLIVLGPMASVSQALENDADDR